MTTLLVAVLAAAVPLLLGWLLRPSAPRAPRSDGGVELRYGSAFRLFPWVLLAAAVALFILIALRPPRRSPGDEWAFVGLAAGLSSLVAVLAHETRRTFLLNTQSIVSCSPWRRNPVRHEWTDLEAARYSVAQQAVVLTFRDGRNLKLSPYLDGLMDAVSLVAQVSAPELLDDGLRALLKDQQRAR